MGTIRQVSFLGGELNPLIHGRTDLATYAKGLRTMRNFFPSRYGAAVSRPGSVYMGTTKDPADSSPRLIPFVFSDTDSYALEFGTNYVRFWKNGAQVLGSALGEAYEVPTTYQSQHLRGVKYAQTGDIITLTRASYAPSELRRLPNWTRAQLDAIYADALAAGAAAADAIIIAGGGNVAAVAAYQAAFNAIWAAAMYAPAAQTQARLNAEALAAADLAAGGNYVTADAAYQGEFDALMNGYVVGFPHWEFSSVVFAPPLPYFGGAAGGYPVIFSPLPTVDAAHPAVEWIWLETLMVQETATGRIFETLPRRITSSWDGVLVTPPIALVNNKVALYPDQPVTIRRGAHLALVTDAANVVDQSYREIEARIYRGRGDPSGRGLGLFGFKGSTTTDTFVDDGAEPNYALQPPRGTNPFLTYDYAGNLASVETPYAVAFFQSRRALAGTYLRPTGMFLSAVDQWTNFDRHTIQVHGESLLFELAARRFEQVVHLISHQQMLVGTKSSVWSFGGAGGAELDFDSVDSRVIDEVGMADVVPLLIDGSVLFVRTKGFGARALSFVANTYGAGHYSGADISHQSDHLFIGNGAQFSVYGQTRALVDWTYAEDPWGLVWAVREDGLLLSLTYKNGEAAWARHDSFTLNGGLSPAGGAQSRYKSVCAIPEGTEDAVYMLVSRNLGGVVGGSATTCVERMASRVRLQVPEDDCALDCAVKYSGPVVGVIPGLAHLIGEQVYVVAVGNPPMGPLAVEDYIVAGVTHDGRVTLPDALVANDGANVVAYVGLGFVADLEVLDVANTSERMKQKTVTAVGIETTESRGLWAGTTVDNLVPVQKRDVVAGYLAPTPDTKLYRPNINGSYSETGRFMVRQKLPLPSTITALTREFNEGER